MEYFGHLDLPSSEKKTYDKVWNSLYLRMGLLQKNLQKWTHKVINSSHILSVLLNSNKKFIEKVAQLEIQLDKKSLMEHVPVTCPFLPVLSTGWASSGFGTGVFLGLAASWLGDGVLSPLTASTQNVFCITELEGTWLSIPLEISQADLGKNKRWFQVTISNMLNGYTTKLNATLNHAIETNKEMVVNSQLFISWCLQPR